MDKEQRKRQFKVITWAWSFKGAGFAVACLNSGTSQDTWFPTPESARAWIDICVDTDIEVCSCKACFMLMLEKNLLGKAEND